MRIAFWIPKATNTHTHTHTGCVIPVAFPLQQWLHERASVLRYTYVYIVLYTRGVHVVFNISFAEWGLLGTINK
jgi:hypothetical protein